MEEYLSINRYRFKSEFPLLEKQYPILSKIVPPMQHACALLIDLAKTEGYNRVTIFGSSVTWKFRNNSDLDICIDASFEPELLMKQVTEALAELPIEFDLICWNTLSSPLLRSEIEKGVVIYDRSIDAG